MSDWLIPICALTIGLVAATLRFRRAAAKPAPPRQPPSEGTSDPSDLSRTEDKTPR